MSSGKSPAFGVNENIPVGGRSRAVEVHTVSIDRLHIPRLTPGYDEVVCEISAEVRKIREGGGQGRVWTGSQAKERGLVDDFGGLDKAIEVAKQLANIPADKGVQRVIFPYPTTFLQQLLSGGGENSNTKVEQQRAMLAALPEDARRAFRYMMMMDRMKDGDTMLLMPFDLRVK